MPVSNDKQYEQAMNDILAIYSQAEKEMLEKVAKRVAKGITTEGWNETKLKDTQELNKELAALMKKVNNTGQKKIAVEVANGYLKSKHITYKETAEIIKNEGFKIGNGKVSGNTWGKAGYFTDNDEVLDFYGGLMTQNKNKGKETEVIEQYIKLGKTKKINLKYGSEAGTNDTSAFYGSLNHDNMYIEAAKQLDEDAKKYFFEQIKSINPKDKVCISKETGVAVNEWDMTPEQKSNKSQYFIEKPNYYVGTDFDKLKKAFNDTVKKFKYDTLQIKSDNGYVGYDQTVVLNNKSLVSKEEAENVVEDAIEKMSYEQLLEEAPIPMNLKQLVKATNGLLDNASSKILRNANDVYQRIMANGTTGLLAGVDTRIQATQKMLNEYAAKGITSFVDKAGRNWNLSSYAEMCARTVSSHAALQGHIERQNEVGEDLVKVSTIGTTCPICQRWQGVVLSISGNNPKYHSLDEAKAAGLFHPNCKHTLGMYIPELDDGTDHEGKVEPTPLDMNSQSSKRNKLIEKQRANERKIRYWKKRKALAITPEEQKKCNEKIKAWQYKNLIHCEKNGLRRQYAREGVRTGNPNGPMGTFIGGSLKEYEEVFKNVVGEDPKKVFKYMPENFKTGDSIFEISGDVSDMFLTQSAKEKALEAISWVKTASDLKKYLGDKGYEMEIASKALKEKADEEIPSVKKQIDYVIAAIEQYEELGGLSSIKKIHFFDSELDVQGCYYFKALQEGDFDEEGHIHLSNNMTGFQVMHEFAHAWADSVKPNVHDVVTWSAFLNEKANLKGKAYFGASQSDYEAEKFADAIGAAFAYGKEDKLEFLSKVANLVNETKYNFKSFSQVKKATNSNKLLYAKWLKEEIASLDELDVDKAMMKDANNKNVTPTSLYKKYIGDNPTQDWSEVSPYEKSTKEYKSGYAKWLKQQIEEIGVSYKVKPKYVEVHEDIPDEDTKLSATEIYKKYHDGEKPTEAYKKLGGEEGTGVKYGKWVENKKKELIKNGVTKTVPFNAATDKTVNVIAKASSTIHDAKLVAYKSELDNTVTGAYSGSQAVKKAYQEIQDAKYNGTQDELNLAENKYKIAKAKHIEMVKKKAQKSYGTPNFAKEKQDLLDKLLDLAGDDSKIYVHSHIDNQYKAYEEVEAEKKAEAKQAAKLKKIQEAELKKKIADNGGLLPDDKVIEECINQKSSDEQDSLKRKLRDDMKKSLKEMGVKNLKTGSRGTCYFDIHDYYGDDEKKKAIKEMKPWQAVGDYTSGSRPHNFAYKENKSAKDYFNGARYTREQAQYIDTVLDKAFEVQSATMTEKCVLRHGNDEDGLIGLLGDDLDYENYSHSMFIDRLKQLNQKTQSGETVILNETGYLSTSPFNDGGFTDKPVEVRILCLPGTKGLYVDDFSYYKGEQETLLKRNQKFKFVKAYSKDIDSDEFSKIQSQMSGSGSGSSAYSSTSTIIYLHAIPE